MGVNEGSLQVIGIEDNGKLTYSIIIRYILTSSACVESTLVQWLSKDIPGTKMHAGKVLS